MRILIFGGAFDPVHKGHLEMANSAEKVFKFDEVWFVPCLESRYGKVLSPHHDRISMLDAAHDDYGNPKFMSMNSEMEANAKGRMYTLACFLKEQYPEHEFVYLIGTDTLYNIESWYQYDRLMMEYTFIIVSRPEYLDQPNILPNSIRLKFDVDDQFDVSSTVVREHIREEGTSPLVTDGVNHIIGRRKLYV